MLKTSCPWARWCRWALLDSALLRFPPYTLKHLGSSTVPNFCKRRRPVIMLLPQALYFRAIISSTFFPLASQTSAEMGDNWIGMTTDKPSPTLSLCSGFQLIGCLYLLATDFGKTSQGLFFYSSNMDIRREISQLEKRRSIFTSTVSFWDLDFEFCKFFCSLYLWIRASTLVLKRYVLKSQLEGYGQVT